MATLTLRADLDTVDSHPHLIFDYAQDEEKWLAEYDRAYEKVNTLVSSDSSLFFIEQFS